MRGPLLRDAGRDVAAGFGVQAAFYRRNPNELIPLLTAPLFTVIFTMIVRHGGRADLTAYAVIAPFFMTLWWLVIFHSGNIIETERRSGTLELLAAAPATFGLVIAGRIAAVMALGLASFAEVWVFAVYGLRVTVVVHHPWLLAATLALTAVAMACTGLLFAGLFVLARAAVTFSNSLSYPFYVLGGIIVPITFLPFWLRPVSRLIFLSWSADMLRSSLAAAPASGAPLGLTMIGVLAVGALLLGVAMLRRILRRVRSTGELNFQ